MSALTKRAITSRVSTRLRGLITALHTYSVVNILIDEIVAELKAGRSVNILGFGKFELVELKERIVVSVNDGEQKRTKQSRALRFRLSAAFKRLLASEDKI